MSRLLEIRGLSKTFPGQVALNGVDFAIEAGRTHAVVGQNGSGKSTLIKVLAGYHQPDGGASAELAGKPLPLGDGRAAFDGGIRFVHQDLALVEGLNAVENISMGVGYTTGRFGRINWSADTKRAADALSSLGFTDINVNVPVAALSPAQKTAVAVARALHGWEEHAHLLVLDEPTASLPGQDKERLFAAIRILKARNVAILYVSHHLDEVFEIADDVTVLRDGQRVTTTLTSQLDHDSLIELMIGHRLVRSLHSSAAVVDSTPTLRVEGLTGATVRGVDLVVHPGEIVGVAGITGSGREALAPLITGQRPSVAGQVFVEATAIANYAPGAAIAAGMAFVPADRSTNGVIPMSSVAHNLTIADVRRHWRGGRLRHKEETGECVNLVDDLRIKTAGTAVPITALSGGNQQKVLFGRSLRLQPKVLVLDEPTSGIDVDAKAQIMKLIDESAQKGAAVLVVSTDTDELIQVAHRILIMVGGRVVADLSGAEMTAENVERTQLQTEKVSSR
jgi:ribose transport system ATP-binding protein